MYPQKRTGRHPVLEFFTLKEPSGRSLILGLASNVVICGRIRWRKPLVDVLFYLGPWAEFSLHNEYDTGRIIRTLYFLYIALYLLHGLVGFISI
jgi:hypothetical protein